MLHSLRIFLVASFLGLLGQAAFAQTPEGTPEEFYRAELNRIVAAHPQGARLFEISEVFRHIAENKAEAATFLRFGSSRGKRAESLEGFEIDGPFNLSNEVGSQNETTVAISRTDTNIIVAGANDEVMYAIGMPVFLSTNAGRSWELVRVPNIEDEVMTSGGDPVLIADEAGGFYYAFLVYNPSDFFATSDLMVAHSKNGRDWDLCSQVVGKTQSDAIFEDKQWMAVDRDPSSPHYGRVYMVWHSISIGTNTSEAKISWSDDRGMNWSEPTVLETDMRRFMLVRTGKKGSLYITGSTDLGSHDLLRSDDGGQSFTQYHIDDFIPYPGNSQGRTGLKGVSGFRSFPQIGFDVDPVTDDLYLLYCSYDEESAEGTMYFAFSNDGGNNFEVQQIKDDGAGDRFHPALSYDPVGKVAVACYYTSEGDSKNLQTKIKALAIHRNKLGESQWVQKLSFNPRDARRTGGPFIGDYMGLDAFNGKMAAVWTQPPVGKREADVFGASFNVPQPLQGTQGNSEVEPVLIGASRFEIASASASESALNFILNTAVNDRIDASIYDASGKRVLRTSLEMRGSAGSIDVSSLPGGFYYLTLKDGSSATHAKFVKH